MKTLVCALAGIALIGVGVSISQEVMNTIMFKNTPAPPTFTFMEVHLINEGKTDNERFFLGPLPKEGEAVEMVYVGSTPEGGMRLQLRTKSLQPAFHCPPNTVFTSAATDKGTDIVCR